jgi:AcrR family transcriptional regulator
MGPDQLDEDHSPRRRERGRRRIESILDTAEQVIADVGYDAATTNLIAARAGISPGSLYQFFANKPAITEALAQRYVNHLAATLDGVFEPPPPAAGVTPTDVAQLIDRIVDPVLAFNLAHPAATSLLTASNVPTGLAQSTQALHASLCDRVEALLGALVPGLNARDRHLSAVVTFQIFAGLLPTIVAASRRDRPRVLRELKTVLASYWMTLVNAAERATAPTGPT